MTASFEDNNRAYLNAAVEWLCLRLAAVAAAHAAPPPSPPSAASTETTLVTQAPVTPVGELRPRRIWWRGNVAAPPIAPPAPPDVPPPAQLQAAEALAKAAARMREAETASPQPALPALAQTLGLSDFEHHVLLLCAAMELDLSLPGLCARAAGNDARPWPTFGLALAVFEEPRWDIVSPERPLRFWRLVEIAQSGVQPLVSAPLRIDERIGAFISGMNYLDERLSALLQPLDDAPDAGELPPSQAASVDEALTAIAVTASSADRICIQLVGADAATRRTVAGVIAARLKRRALMLTADSVPQAAETDALVRLWKREDRLLPLVLLIELPDADLSAEVTAETATPRTRLLRIGARAPGVILVVTLDPVVLPGSVVIALQRPSPDEQADCWCESLGDEHAAVADELAAQFSLDMTSIRGIAARVLVHGDEDVSLRDRLWLACVRHSRPALEGLAQQIEPRQGWDALKLPDREMATLSRVLDHVRHRAMVHGGFGFRQHLSRGLGTAALFWGESGTGKTLAAEVLAAELGLALYRIDLAGIMNKYIGVTEQHIRQIFDAGDGAVLFFDECDALFGRRSEVKDSHDRYANIQVDYMLQRMESYSGLAILATNLRSSIDPAFLRRLGFVVNFPFPGPEQRTAIWRNSFPAATPLGPLDLGQLAKLPLTGGSIQNIAIDAAFRAAAAGSDAVSMAHIAAAAQDEMRKIERPPSLAQFRWAGDLGQRREHAS